MAYTKIHAIKATVDKAIDYICNPDKTDEQIYVSSYACAPETAAIDFKYTLDHCRENSPNKAYHLIQAFAPGEVSYEEAHRIGKELAKERFVRGSTKSLGKEYTKERIRERIEMKRERKSVTPKKDYSAHRLIDTSDEKFQSSPGLQQWAAIENLKIAAQSYNEVGSLSNLKDQITVKTEAGKSAKQSVVKLEHRMKDLTEIIKYAEQYKDNRSYHIAYKKSKNPDAYFRRYESQLILYGGARRVLEQTGINLKGLNVDKLKAEYQELMKQKNEMTSTYKNCEKEVQSLNRKLENLNQYLGQTQPNFTSEQSRKKNILKNSI